MYESIVSKIANVVRATVRAIASVTRKSPWLAPATIVVLFLIW